ncbi:amino acid ABC transporter permease [Amycolatopsis pigmentata]|uniref:Amino acid ABC transporter permease n=1 Tax=Amycolatopsis pigmentata TaxID=450801 RepID=A0ABW5FYY4_9PSEU
MTTSDTGLTRPGQHIDRTALAAAPIRSRTSFGAWATYVLAALAVAALVHLFVFNDNWHWPIVGSYLFSQVVVTGVLHTIELTALTTVLGLAIGVVTAWCRTSSFAVLRVSAFAYIWVMRATPPLVMLLVVYFFGALVPRLSIGIPFGPGIGGPMTNDLMTRFTAAVVGLAVYLGAYSAETFRTGILSLPPGQLEACRSLGLPAAQAYLRILGPQLIRVITPALANEVITVFKNTSLVSIIGYAELLSTVQNIYAVNFQTIPLLTVAVLWYLVLTSFAMFAQHRLERRLGRGFANTRRTTEPREGKRA